MAITNVAAAGTQGPFATMKSWGVGRADMDLDNSYPTGGYTNFVATTLKGVSGWEHITVVHIPDQIVIAGGNAYLAHWDRANDTLEMYRFPTAVGPATEVPNAANLAAWTNVEIVFFYI